MVEKKTLEELRKELEIARKKRELRIQKAAIKKELRDIKTEKARRFGKLFVRGAAITGRTLGKGIGTLGAVGRRIEAQKAIERKVVRTVTPKRKKRRKR